VRALIETHEQLLDTVKSCFGSNALFHRALRDGFEAFVNQDNRVSKVLARFANDVLKKHSTVASRDVNATLDSIVCLYGYLTDKDVFERDYQRYLANRLLLGLCESEHHEKAMITKLKTECGYQWTNRLEGMFRDVQISRELQLAFRQIFDTERSLGLALEVNVCTTGYWPQSRPTPGNLPRELAEACEKFRGFYLGKKSGQKLEWHLDQGQAEVQVVFAPGTRRFLVCSTYQMLILLAFNTSNKPVSYGDILRITGLPPAEAAAPLAGAPQGAGAAEEPQREGARGGAPLHDQPALHEHQPQGADPHFPQYRRGQEEERGGREHQPSAPAPGRRRHRAHYEDAQASAPQPAGHRGGTAAAGALQAAAHAH
jgi:hypothetical protein